MKHKWRIPILLLAAVIMLSIFYIMDGNKASVKPVTGDDYVVSALNPEFTESRLASYTKAQEEIAKLEESIALGKLSHNEVEACVSKINDIKHTKAMEVSLEEAIITEFSLSDALVVVDNDKKEIIIDVYASNSEQIVKDKFIEVALLALKISELNYQVTLLDSKV